MVFRKVSRPHLCERISNEQWLSLHITQFFANLLASTCANRSRSDSTRLSAITSPIDWASDSSFVSARVSATMSINILASPLLSMLPSVSAFRSGLYHLDCCLGLHVTECDAKSFGLHLCLRVSQDVYKGLASTSYKVSKRVSSSPSLMC